jgi:hypothetical protein
MVPKQRQKQRQPKKRMPQITLHKLILAWVSNFENCFGGKKRTLASEKKQLNLIFIQMLLHPINQTYYCKPFQTG